MPSLEEGDLDDLVTLEIGPVEEICVLNRQIISIGVIWQRDLLVPKLLGPVPYPIPAQSAIYGGKETSSFETTQNRNSSSPARSPQDQSF